jgi:transcriptional regulator
MAFEEEQMTAKQAGIVKWRKRGYTYAQLTEKYETSMAYVNKVLTQNGMTKVRQAPKAEKIGKNIGNPSTTETRIPKGLNGLTRVWQSAEKLIDRAKRIKAAVKELNKAMHI